MNSPHRRSDAQDGSSQLFTLRNFASAFCTVIELIVVCHRVVSERSVVEVIRVSDHVASFVFSCFNSGTELCGSGTRVVVTQQ